MESRLPQKIVGSRQIVGVERRPRILYEAVGVAEGGRDIGPQRLTLAGERRLKLLDASPRPLRIAGDTSQPLDELGAQRRIDIDNRCRR